MGSKQESPHIPELNVRSMGKELQMANHLFKSVDRELNERRRVVRLFFPTSRERLISKLGTQKGIVEREKQKLDEVIASFRGKISLINGWQDEDDSCIGEAYSENQSLSEEYSELVKVRDKIKAAYEKVSSSENPDMKDKTSLRMTLRGAEGRIGEIVQTYNSNKRGMHFDNLEVEQFEAFRGGIEEFYYNSVNLDEGLERIVDHTSKILSLFKDIGHEIKVVSRYTQQGIGLWDDVISYALGLERVYAHLRDPSIPLKDGEGIMMGSLSPAYRNNPPNLDSGVKIAERVLSS